LGRFGALALYVARVSRLEKHFAGACGSGFVAALVTRLTMSAILRGKARQTIAMFVRFNVSTNENC